MQLLSRVFFAVGKTSLITRFMYDSFDNIYQVIITGINMFRSCLFYIVEPFIHLCVYL